MTSKTIASALAVAILSAVSAARGADLSVGDEAPPLEVAGWVKGGPISEFEPGETYVVEFWATWCGPCKTSIPHLTELQERYEDQGLEVIGVSVFERDYEAVAPFVEEMGDAMDYNVAIDAVPEGADAGAMAENWMEAAGMTGIPTAFIVHDETIYWIGHPMAIDEPLAQVLSGELDLAIVEAMAEFVERIGQVPPGDIDGAIAAIDEAIAGEPKLEPQLGFSKYNLMLQAGRTADAVAYGEALMEGAFEDDPMALNNMAWLLVDPGGGPSIDRDDLDFALRAAERANELTGGADANILDTLAKAYYDSGKLIEAVKHQAKAVELSGDDADPALRERLDLYRKALERASA